MPIMAERLAWHREKLAELEGYLEALGEDPAIAGVRASLLVGVGYESLIVGALERALDAGATVQMPAQDMFWGDRYGVVTDPYGHKWSFATHIKDVTPEEMRAAMKDAFARHP